MAATQEDILREAALNRIRQLGSATLQKELLYAPLKREIIKTLHDNALLRQTLMRPLMQIYKQRLLREDHTPAATLIENLTAAINLVTVYDHLEQKLEECDLFIEKIEAIDNLLQSGKANFKLEIIKFLKENDINPETIMEYIGSTARSLAGRTGHTPTDALITGLNRLNQRPGLDTATSHKCFEYSEQLAFIKNSKDINNRIVEYLNTTQFSHLLNFKDKIIPSLENLNLLLQDQVKPSLQTLQDIKKKQALIERLELLKERMKEAAENKASLSDLEQKARQFSELLIDNDRLKPANEFSKSINKIVDSKNQEIDLTDKRIATIEQEIDKNKKELETKNKELSDADSHIATVFGNINDSSITDELKDEIELLQREREAHANDIHILTRRIKEKEDERDTLEKEREELQQYTSQLDVIKGYCVSNIEQIMLTQDQIRKEWAFHEELNTFAVYIKDGDSILATLQKVASYLCGGNDQTHAIGKINILLLIGAGVKAGPDLGLIEISAEIRLTIIIKGQLSVMDDRRVSFSYKLGLHLSCESSFRLGVDDSIEQYIAAASEYTGALKPPTSLLDAAAKAGVNMYEKETFHVYNSVSHWSHRWSDRINKRINFLNKYKSGTRQIIHSPEMARVLDSRPEQKSQIITAFGKHEESMALANQPSLQIIFENKTLLTTEGQLSLADRPVTEKSTQRSHTFEMYQTQENLNPPSWLSATDIFSDKRNVLGSIYESYTDFEYKKDEATIKGWSLYHKLLQSGKQQEFLEVYQNK
jgi:hypothetical protein